MNDEYVLIMDAPGMQKSDFAISCGGGRLIVTGRMTPSEQTGVRNEKWNHEFTRTFTLPETAEVQRIWAEVDDNELAVHVPKREQVHARRVAVK
jgi:HSP20 family protein